MAFLDGVLRLVKQNTLDRTNLDERAVQGVKGLVNNVKANLASLRTPIVNNIQLKPGTSAYDMTQPIRDLAPIARRAPIVKPILDSGQSLLEQINRELYHPSSNIIDFTKNIAPSYASTVLNTYGASKLLSKPSSLIPFAGLGAVFNPRRPIEGAIESINAAPMVEAVGSGINPVTEKLETAVAKRFATPATSWLRKQLIEKGTAGVGNAVFGSTLRAAQGQNPLDPAALAQEIAIGAGNKTVSPFLESKYGPKVKGSIGRPSGTMHPEDVGVVDRVNAFLNDKKPQQYTSKDLSEVFKNIDVLAERYLTNKEIDTAYAKVGERAVNPSLQRAKEIAKLLMKKARDVNPDYGYADRLQFGFTAKEQRPSAQDPLPFESSSKSQSLDDVFGASNKSEPLPVDTPQKPASSWFDETFPGIRQKFHQLYTQAIDRFHPISELGKKAGDEQSVSNALTGYYGAGSTANYHVNYELAPILKEHNINDLRRVAIAQRDAELAGRGIKGSNTGVSMDALAKELGPEKVAQVQQTLQKLYGYQDSIVKNYLVDTGIMSKEQYKAMRAKNQFYVPFKRVMDQVDEYLGGVPQTKGAGSVASQDVIKGIKGSDRAIQDPIESIIEATYKMVGLGKRQQVARTIVGLKDKLPQGMVQKIKGPVGKQANIALFENGKVQHYAVPPEVADAAKGMSEEGLNTLVKILAVPTKVFRASATGINPEFMLPNVARDLQSAFVNAGLNPLKWVSGLAHLMKKDAVYQDFLKSGGQTSRISLDRPMLKQTVDEITNPQGFSIKKPGDLLKILQTLGEYSEQPTRIATFEEALNKNLKAGLSPEEARIRAAGAAQEGTVNFARRGSKTQAINAIYAFLNARIQGIDRLARTVKRDPTGAGFRLGMVSVAPAMALYAWNRSFPSYQDSRVVSDRDKENNFILMLSDEPLPQLGGAQYVKIPKGEVGKLANPVESFLSYADGQGGDVQKSLMTTLKAFLPADNIGDAIPTALRPPIENAANYSFFSDQQIVPDYKKDYPAPYQYTSFTSPLYRMIGAETNQSPAKVQNLVEGYGTGLAKIGELATRPFIPDQYKSVQSEQGADVNRTPLVRRFIGGAKRTEEEQQAIDEKKTASNLYKIRDIQSAMRRGDIPLDVGLDEIKRIQGEPTEQAKKQSLQGLFGGTAAAQPQKEKTVQQEKIADSVAKIKLENSGDPYLQENGKIYLMTDRGTVDVIDIRKPIEKPQLTGQKELDKELMSKYKGQISARENDIAALFKAGLISQEEAERQLKELDALKKGSSGGGGGRKVKMPKLPKLGGRRGGRRFSSSPLSKKLSKTRSGKAPKKQKSSIEDILSKKRKSAPISNLLK